MEVRRGLAAVAASLPCTRQSRRRPLWHHKALSNPPHPQVIYAKVKKLDTEVMGGVAVRALSAAATAVQHSSMAAAAAGGGSGGAAAAGAGAGAEATADGGAGVDAAADAWDPLPRDLVSRHGLMVWRDALRALHAPVDAAEHARARQRLAFQVRGHVAGHGMSTASGAHKALHGLVPATKRDKPHRKCFWASSRRCLSAAA